MKTKFIAIVFAAMFPIGAIAQISGDAPQSAPDNARNGNERNEMNTGVQGSGYYDSTSSRFQSRNQAKGFVGEDIPAAQAARRFPDERLKLQDQGLALGLQGGQD